MERIREARRMIIAAAPNGLSRRRQHQQHQQHHHHHRTNSLRDSPEDDGAVELHETGRLRDRGSGKRDRDPDRDRERERERDRDRDRNRLARSKRRRGDRMILSNREDGGDDSSEESINDDEDDEDEDGSGGAGGGSMRMLPPGQGFSSTSSLLNHRKSFPPPTKVLRPAPTWKTADEMIGVSVPRKARSASTKRSHDCWVSSGGIVGEQFHRQTSTSPARTSGASGMVIGASQSPASPSSSSASVRKKLKPSNGAKLRPPKSCSKSSSSAQDEIEIEIAEVLYGMMRQPQGPTKQEIVANESIKLYSTETINKSSCDAKSRVSSPISNSQSAPPLSTSIPPQNSGSSITAISAVAPKRKRPRPVKYDEESLSTFTACSSPISSMAKTDCENQPSKIETSSPKKENTAGSTPENCSVSCDAVNTQSLELHPEPVKMETAGLPESKTTAAAMESESRDSKDEAKSPKKHFSAQRKSGDNREVEITKASPMFEVESQREGNFPIDLMAPPAPLRSSPERDGDIDFVALETKPGVADAEMVHEVKLMIKEDEKGVKVSKSEAVAGENDMARIVAEETESHRPVLAHCKERNIDLQLDLEKGDRDSGTGSAGNKKVSQNSQRRQQQHLNPEKNAQSNSLPLQMPVPSWPGLPTMGYMSPLQGVVSMDGSTVSSAVIPPPHLFFNQPRPKRCATHCYVARNISYHQQIARMNPFWPAAASSASLYATKPSNPSVVPSADPHNIITGRNATFAQEKGPSLPIFPGHFGKEKGSHAVNMVESAQRKQILLQQSLPPGAPSNILHGPAFIFSLNQQQAAAAASVCPGALKSSSNAGSVSSSSTSCTAPVSASATGPATAPAMSFSYPNVPGNETQYLAILQNNGYPFPIPAHVGAPPAYRGTHPQALPFFNGSFYSSQIIHPSQLQQQQQQQQLPAQSQHSHQGRQSTSFSCVTSSQKHLQNNQQQKPNGGSGSLHNFPPKNQSLQQQQQQQQRQTLQSHHIPHRTPQMESEMGSEENPATDGRFSRAAMSLYGQNFAIPMQPANFTFMTSTSVSGMNTPSSSSEKKQQHQVLSKAGVETSQAFAMPFAPINGSSAPAIDLSSFPQNHPILQSQGYQMMAAAAAAAVAQQKSYHGSEEVKAINGDSSNAEGEKKSIEGMIPASIGQSIAFSRSDMMNPSICAMPGNTVIDSSVRALNLGSASGRPSNSVVHAAMSPVYAAASQQQLPRNQQQQQILQLHKNQQFAAVARSKSSTSNVSVYSDHLPSTSSVTTKFAATASPFPQTQNLVQSGNPPQSTQWKNSGRAPNSQPTSQSLLSAPSSAKALPQSQGRSQQSHMQISFAANSKSPTAPIMQPAVSNQSPSPPIMVGSPTTSSMSKSAGGSPRTTSSSTSNKFSQASSLSSQQVKNPQSVPSSKSSPVGGKNVPSILGSPHLTPTPITATKSQVPQQQHQPHISKQALQQAQLFFSNAYMHAQTSQSSKRKDVPKN